MVDVRDQYDVHAFDVEADTTIIGILRHAYLEIMCEFPCIYREIPLIGLECYTILDCGP